MKYKTEWNLGLLYKGDKDPQIEKDIRYVESLCSAFEKEYRVKDFVSSAKKLRTALSQYQILSDESLHKPWFYFYLRKDIDSSNAEVRAKSTVVEQRIHAAYNKVTFFVLALGKIPKSQQQTYLNSKDLQEFSYYLERIFLFAKYNLSESEEQLNTLLSQTSQGMWIDAQKKLISEQKVPYKGVFISLSEAREILTELPRDERHELHAEIVAVTKSIGFLAEAELNAIVNYKKILGEKRGYKESYSETILSNENTEKEIKEFTALVTEHFSISHRFFKLHAKLLGQKKLNLSDRRVAVGSIEKKFDFDATLSVTKKALSRAGKTYGDMVDRYVTSGQIDVYPRKGKEQGGYCFSLGSLPTFILLNHANTLRSVETLAHEMGHAIHGELDNHLPIFYQGHSTATAEVASTFFEQFVDLEVEQYLSGEEKMFALHRKIAEDVHTIFCQVACFNFEVELHERIRAEGQLSKEQMAKLMQKHLQAYTGSAMNVSEDEGYTFATWLHIRMFFYTYTYAYGLLISRTLFEKWKENPAYITKVEQFLSAGRSMSPKDIFKSIGIPTNKAFFEAGLKGIEADIIKLEKLAKKHKKI